MQSPMGRFGVVPHAGTHDMGLVFQFQVGDIKITYLKPSAWSGLLPSLVPNASYI